MQRARTRVAMNMRVYANNNSWLAVVCITLMVFCDMPRVLHSVLQYFISFWGEQNHLSGGGGGGEYPARLYADKPFVIDAHLFYQV